MSTRDADLAELNAKVQDMSLPYWKRREYYHKLQNIYKQTKDSKLERLRTALIRATIAGDRLWIWKYQGQIKQHLKEERLDRW